MSIIKEHRVGRFSIPEEILHESPELVQQVLATVIVVRAESMFAKRSLDYCAFSEHFEPCEPGNEPPVYDMNVTEDGAVTWTQV